MALTIQLNSGLTLTDPVTVAKLNQMWTLGNGEVIAGTVDEADITNEAVTLAKMADLVRGYLISGQTVSNRPTALNAKEDGYILIGDGTDVNSVAVSGIVTLSNAGVTAITLTDGKVLIGNASNVAAAQSMSGDITISNAGVTAIGKVIEGDQVKEVDDGNTGVPIITRKSFNGTVTDTDIWNANCPFKLRIVDVMVGKTSAGSLATTLTLYNGANAITDAMEIYTGVTGATNIIRCTEINTTYSTINQNGSLKITLSNTTTAPAGIVFITAIPVT